MPEKKSKLKAELKSVSTPVPNDSVTVVYYND